MDDDRSQKKERSRKLSIMSVVLSFENDESDMILSKLTNDFPKLVGKRRQNDIVILTLQYD